MSSATLSKTRHRVATVAELLPGAHKVITAGRFEIGVFNVNGQFRAVLNVCPHELAPICSGAVRGTVLPSKAGEYSWGNCGEIIACPWHGWEFNLHDGKSLHDERCRLKTFPVVVEDNVVFVEA
jgi:3-phenylpropionate/trans-cinnamate dioxygenase ferredoxin subunit